MAARGRSQCKTSQNITPMSTLAPHWPHTCVKQSWMCLCGFNHLNFMCGRVAGLQLLAGRKLQVRELSPILWPSGVLAPATSRSHVWCGGCTQVADWGRWQRNICSATSSCFNSRTSDDRLRNDDVPSLPTPTHPENVKSGAATFTFQSLFFYDLPRSATSLPLSLKYIYTQTLSYSMEHIKIIICKNSTLIYMLLYIHIHILASRAITNVLTLLWCIGYEPCLIYLCIWAHLPSIIAPWSWSLSLTYRENKREWKTERQRKNIYIHTTYTGSKKETGQNNADSQTRSRTHTEDKERVRCAQLLSQGMRRSQVQVWVLKPLCKIKLTDIKLRETTTTFTREF